MATNYYMDIDVVNPQLEMGSKTNKLEKKKGDSQ